MIQKSDKDFCIRFLSCETKKESFSIPPRRNVQPRKARNAILLQLFDKLEPMEKTRTSSFRVIRTLPTRVAHHHFRVIFIDVAFYHLPYFLFQLLGVFLTDDIRYYWWFISCR